MATLPHPGTNGDHGYYSSTANRVVTNELINADCIDVYQDKDHEDWLRLEFRQRGGSLHKTLQLKVSQCAVLFRKLGPYLRNRGAIE